MKIVEIILHNFGQQQLTYVAGGGDFRPTEMDEPRGPLVKYPAPVGELWVYPEWNRFYLVVDGQPAARMSVWGERNSKEIGPVAALLVADPFRKQGMGKMLYRALLDAGYTIKSGENHTQHSKILWQWLATQPDIAITALDGKTHHPVTLDKGEMRSAVPIYGNSHVTLWAKKR